ncbi:uncharacterized protein JCM15063_003675 [Sporobolomyces koalae]|uniref:uncharacterized protein n=1 Tax=Sporobolomyces koalae TaxID=500713 RepID=UPI003175680C
MASSRLRRKIETAEQGELGNLTESFVSIGTPLPALTDAKKDKNEFKPVWQQEVYDDQGRRRLHGAFTGGFSAGYYNTVGSKEGWTPSTFKSSRSQRASSDKRDTAEAARAYMDEEDLEELASSRKVETSSTYGIASEPLARTSEEYDPLLGSFGSRRSMAATKGPSEPTSIFDDTLASLIGPSSERVGFKLMKKMGWREGQGVGPRMTYDERKRQAVELGVTLPSDDLDDASEAQKHLFAPLDQPLVLVKGNTASTERGWGLGYQPGMTLDAQLKTEGAGAAVKHSFGPLGVEEDPYDRDDMAPSSKLNFEVNTPFSSLPSDSVQYAISGSSRGRRSRPAVADRVEDHEKFHDGTPVLRGFTLQSENLTEGEYSSQLPPPPPSNWKPDPSRFWRDVQALPQNDSGKGKARQLDADERGTLLGEGAPPPVPKSVFDYLSAKSRDRLASLTKGTTTTSLPSSSTTPAPASDGKPHGADVQLLVPPLDRPTALAALKGFQPYSAASTSPDPIKQARYTLYLQYQASENASTTSSPFGPRTLANGKTQTVQELNRELSEYAQSARVFKPVSGMLGNRFESSKSGSLDAPKIEPGLYQPPPKDSASSASEHLRTLYGDAAEVPPLQPAPALTPAQVAAREGNFGSLTRSIVLFRPNKLLCKRFGVKDPNEGMAEGADEPGRAFGEATATGWSTGEASRTTQPIGDVAMDQMMQSAGFKRFQEASRIIDENEPEVAKGAFETNTNSGTQTARSKTKIPPTIETVGMGDDDSQGQEIVDEQRAPPDIFAAIFADSDDEDEDEDEIDNEAMVEQEDAGRPPAGDEDSGLHGCKPPIRTTGGTDSCNEVEGTADLDGTTLPDGAMKTADSTTATASPAAQESTEPITVDSLASYRPSFVARPTSSKATEQPSAASNSNKQKKKSQSKRKVALSFAIEDEEGDVPTEREPTRKKARKSRSKTEGVVKHVPDDDEWQEAESRVHPSITDPPKVTTSSGPKGNRMKASDLY